MSLLNRALGMGRSLAESRMTETVTVGLFQDKTDETTGAPIRVLVESKYQGKARVKYPSLAITERSEPAQPVSVQEPYLSIPTGSPALAEGDEILITASAADSRLVGLTARVGGSPQQGQTTSHRYPLRELS